MSMSRAGLGGGKMAQLRLDESLRAVEQEIAAGHPELALAHCQALQAQFPRAIAVQRALGEIFLAQRKPREAVAALDRVLQADPEDARACCLRAYVHQMHGDTHQALSWYARACDVRPDDTLLRSTYRELAASLGLPPYSPSRTGLARLYLRGGLYTHAIREWEALITEHPDALDAQVGLAETLWRGNHIQPATDRCLRILANAPSCIKPMLILAVTHLDAGRLDEAQRLALRASELDADNHIARALLRDRFDAGDVALQKVILGAANQTMPPLIPAPGTAVAVRARTSRPVTNATGTPLAAPQVPIAGKITASTLSEITVDRGRDPALISRVRQTEIMLRGEVTRPATPLPVTAASYLSNGPALVPPTGGQKISFVPPVLAEQGANLEEAEVRQGLQWLQWLQQAGTQAGTASAPTQSAGAGPAWQVATPSSSPAAQPNTASMAGENAAPERTSQALLPTMIPAPSQPQQGQHMGQPPMQAGPAYPRTPATSGVSPIPTSAPNSSPITRLTGPLPLPNAEELRAMFAELEPTSAARSAGAVSPFPTDASTPGLDMSALLSQPGLTPEQRRTLESIERQYANSGFQQVEVHPGLLAELAAQATPQAPAQPKAHDGPPTVPAAEEYDAYDQHHSSPYATYDPYTSAEPEASYPSANDNSAHQDTAPAETGEPTEDDSAPADLTHHLAEARRQRGAGNLDAALGTYGVVLRGAPELVPDVVSDLEAEVAAHPAHPGLHQLLGDARIRQGDYLGALESYNHAVALGQENR